VSDESKPAMAGPPEGGIYMPKAPRVDPPRSGVGRHRQHPRPRDEARGYHGIQACSSGWQSEFGVDHFESPHSRSVDPYDGDSTSPSLVSHMAHLISAITGGRWIGAAGSCAGRSKTLGPLR
jgi:hypothetical protein